MSPDTQTAMVMDLVTHPFQQQTFALPGRMCL